MKLSSLVERYEFHMLPILNPDGYIYTYAENGVSFDIDTTLLQDKHL